MDLATVIGTASSALFVGGVVLGVARWILKNHTQELVKEYLQEMKENSKELKPNHGSSLNDIVKLQVLPILQKLDAKQDQLAEDITEIKVDYARLEGRFDQYVEENKE